LPEQKEPFQEMLESMKTETALFFHGFSKEEREYIRLFKRYIPSGSAQAILPVKFEIH
jgi:hypothetical protein